jgi:hypothetical protein
MEGYLLCFLGMKDNKPYDGRGKSRRKENSYSFGREVDSITAQPQRRLYKFHRHLLYWVTP